MILSKFVGVCQNSIQKDKWELVIRSSLKYINIHIYISLKLTVLISAEALR